MKKQAVAALCSAVIFGSGCCGLFRGRQPISPPPFEGSYYNSPPIMHSQGIPAGSYSGGEIIYQGDGFSGPSLGGSYESLLPPANVPSAPGDGTKVITPTRPPSPDPEASGASALSGIPGFLSVSSDIAVGGQPGLAGFSWLRDRGYKTIVNLREEKLADPSERAEVTRLGMYYVPLPITPATLTRELVDEFNEILDNMDSRPVFFHDLDGKVAGAMWYLRRVIKDGLSHDDALQEAESIGLDSPTLDPSTWSLIRGVLDQQ